MPIAVIDLLFGLFVMAAGVALGWWLSRRTDRTVADSNQDAEQARSVEPHAATVQPRDVPAARSASLQSVPERGHHPICDRTEFCITLARRLAEWRRGGPTPSVLMARIDGYRQIVENHGESTGDVVVKATAQFLSAAIRDMDLVALYDADTYAVLFPGTKPINVIRIAQRLREAVAACTLTGSGVPLQFTVSIGGAKSMENNDTRRLLERSMEALKAAQEAGGNCARFHNGTTPETIEATIEREQQLSEVVAERRRPRRSGRG